jgi:hypothetical protein
MVRGFFALLSKAGDCAKTGRAVREKTRMKATQIRFKVTLPEEDS